MKQFMWQLDLMRVAQLLDAGVRRMREIDASDGSDVNQPCWLEQMQSLVLSCRLALHAMTFGNLRANAQLWHRFLRELRFSHWDPAGPLPRMHPAFTGAPGNAVWELKLKPWALGRQLHCLLFRDQ